MLPALPSQNNFVSVFDDPGKFEHAYKMAEILANSLFVPGGSNNNPTASFRGNPANCLIALDLAGRLSLAPTALFPHLYVINGRPALSSQFIIALVNRSGVFSRIAWDEGTDGEVTYEAYGRQRTVPNYYAEAKFTELSTGVEYRSTRVSVELARASGWLTKQESKWQTLPREMCRWRSAAWLAKNYAPELIFGLDFAEEMFDAAPTVRTYQTTATVRSVGSVVLTGTPEGSSNVSAVGGSRSVALEQPKPQPVAELVDESAEQALLEGINGATDSDQLANVAEAIGRADLTDAAKDRLRDAFRAKRAELVAKTTPVVVAAAVEKPVEPVQPAEEKTKKRKSAKKAEPEQPAPDLPTYSERARQAKTVDELRALYAELQRDFQMGIMPQDEFDATSAELDALAIAMQENGN